VKAETQSRRIKNRVKKPAKIRKYDKGNAKEPAGTMNISSN
jgi:hypothetical protein